MRRDQPWGRSTGKPKSPKYIVDQRVLPCIMRRSVPRRIWWLQHECPEPIRSRPNPQTASGQNTRLARARARHKERRSRPRVCEVNLGSSHWSPFAAQVRAKQRSLGSPADPAARGCSRKLRMHARCLAPLMKSDDLGAPAAGTPGPRPKGSPHGADRLCGQAGVRQGAVAVGGPRRPPSENPLPSTRFVRCSSSPALTLCERILACPAGTGPGFVNRMLLNGRPVRLLEPAPEDSDHPERITRRDERPPCSGGDGTMQAARIQPTRLLGVISGESSNSVVKPG